MEQIRKGQSIAQPVPSSSLIVKAHVFYGQNCAEGPAQPIFKDEAVSFNWAWDLAFEIENIYSSESHIEYFSKFRTFMKIFWIILTDFQYTKKFLDKTFLPPYFLSQEFPLDKPIHQKMRSEISNRLVYGFVDWKVHYKKFWPPKNWILGFGVWRRQIPRNNFCNVKARILLRMFDTEEHIEHIKTHRTHRDTEHIETHKHTGIRIVTNQS